MNRPRAREQERKEGRRSDSQCLRTVTGAAAASGAGILPARFMAPINDSRVIETFHEPSSERGCVEDQPQRFATFGSAAAGAPSPPHSRAPCASRFTVREQVLKEQGTFYDPTVSDTRCSAFDVGCSMFGIHSLNLKHRTLNIERPTSNEKNWRVHGPNACEAIRKEAPNEPSEPPQGHGVRWQVCATPLSNDIRHGKPKLTTDLQQHSKAVSQPPHSRTQARNGRFMGPMHEKKRNESPHESSPDRGCLEDQTQRVATFGSAAAGALLPPHSRAPCASRFMVPMQSFKAFSLRLRRQILLFVAVVVVGNVCIAADVQQSPVRAAEALIARVVPDAAQHFIVETIPADNGRDVFEVESRGDKIVLRGNNPVSIASALNWYLENQCRCDISWNAGNQVKLPRPLPSLPAKIHIVSPHQLRYAYNFCTYGYTMVWWDWPRFEHELDFLALKGVNLALVIEGQESAWIQTFKQFGYSDKAVRQWVVDPAHLPWMEMDNMESYGGPLSSKLVARRLALGQKIIGRMRELGIQPVLPGYYGMVPPDFHKKFPHARVHPQGDWVKLKRPDILDPTDPMFPKVAAAYYKAEQKLFGGADFYDADPFHEGGSTNNIDVPAAGRAIQQAMGDATWVLQSWGQNPRPEMVNALDKDKVLVLDLFCDDHENWRLRNNFDGSPWLWCVVNCFGGNLKMGGRLAWMAQGPDAALTDPHKGRMSGIGALMEGTGVNPALWEMFWQDSWRADVPDMNAWLNQYTERRYGAEIPAAEQAWKILLETAYDDPPAGTAHTVKPAVCSRPTLIQPKLPSIMLQPVQDRPVTTLHYDPDRLVEAWKLLLDAAPQAQSSDAYRFDLCDAGRQVLANLSARYNRQIVEAYRAHDAQSLHAASDKMLGLIQDMDELAGTRREWLLGVWLADARSWGASREERDLCERNARELLTTWTRYDNIPDYANRQWNGLLGDFYYHRWKLWLDALNSSVDKNTLLDEKSVNAEIRNWEVAWTRQTDAHYLTNPRGNAVAISQKLYAKYARDASMPN